MKVIKFLENKVILLERTARKITKQAIIATINDSLFIINEKFTYTIG